MIDESHFRKLENMMHSAPIVKMVGARVKISEGQAEITLPVKKDLFHAANQLHGSMYFLALDNAAWFAVNSLVDDVFVLTVSFNIYLIKAVSEGVLKAVGKVTSAHGDKFFAESVLYDAENQEIARGNGFFVKSKIKLSPEIGYR